MGHDPPAYRVWVRLVGLPLQAWTPSEIAHFTQHFGHPLEIIPFGRQAGHFKDITVMIACNHLSHIPQAYSYREGDYSTRVDIHILESRTWEEGYFPPPEDRPYPRNTRAQSRHQANSSGHGRFPSHSSSGNPPSEPTVDLSAWSPRSYRGAPLAHEQTQKIHATSLTQKLTAHTPRHHIHLRSFIHDRAVFTVTKNPKLPYSDKDHTVFWILLDPLPIPNPISLKPPYPPLTLAISVYTYQERRKDSVQLEEKATYGLTQTLRLLDRETHHAFTSRGTTNPSLQMTHKRITEEYSIPLEGLSQPARAHTHKGSPISLMAHMTTPASGHAANQSLPSQAAQLPSLASHSTADKTHPHTPALQRAPSRSMDEHHLQKAPPQVSTVCLPHLLRDPTVPLQKQTLVLTVELEPPPPVQLESPPPVEIPISQSHVDHPLTLPLSPATTFHPLPVTIIPHANDATDSPLAAAAPTPPPSLPVPPPFCKCQSKAKGEEIGHKTDPASPGKQKASVCIC